MTERVPAVRFHEFTGEWEETRLGDHLALSRGLTYSPRSVRPHGVRVLRSSNIAEDRLVLREDDVFVAPEIVNVGLASDSDILITAANGSTRLVGKHCVVSGVKNSPSVPGGFMLLGKTATPHFTQALLGAQWYEGFINRNVAGGNGAIGNLRPNDLSFEVIPFPTLSEQQKIGELFEHLDSLIDLGRTGLQKLRQMKTAMLGKMFPKPGAKVPEVRFPGFGGEWEERELGEVADIVGGGTPSTTNRTFWGGDIDWYAPAEIGEQRFADKSQRQITPEGLKASSAVILPAHRTVLFTSRAGIGNMAILRKEACTNQGFQSLVVTPENDPYFVYSMGRDIKKRALAVASGSTFLEISGRTLGQLRFRFPSVAEQQKIGDLFENLDSLIELQAKQNEKLSQIKRSLLSKMFV